MPCTKCSNGKWKLGSGKCMYTTLEKCKKAEQAYYASKKEIKSDEYTRRDSNKKDLQ